MPPKSKLDSFFKKKDSTKKKEPEKKSEQPQQNAENAEEFGIHASAFDGAQAVKLSKNDPAVTVDEENEDKEKEPVRTWGRIDSPTKEEEKPEEPQQQQQQQPATGAYRPGGFGVRPKPRQAVDLGSEDFPSLAEAQKIKDKPAEKTAPAPKPKPQGNVWTARSAASASGKSFNSWSQDNAGMNFSNPPNMSR